MNKNQALPQVDGSLTIEKNGVVLICPFTPPLVLPGARNQISGEQQVIIQRLPCSTACPHCNAYKRVKEKRHEFDDDAPTFVMFEISCVAGHPPKQILTDTDGSILDQNETGPALQLVK